MIFNPLFFSETGNSNVTVAKPNKLAKNKYLFSDIVKVVMNPEREQKKLLETNIENIVNPDLKLIPGKDQNPARLKLQILGDSETEKAKLELADILPEDIAELLMDEKSAISKDKALSYLSKEPLNSDLQVFLNGLVGEELLKNNINKDTGVFLSLEDNKSAVNIELTQELSNKKSNDKIIVQTLVVPEKSKLISLMNNSEKVVSQDGEIIDSKKAVKLTDIVKEKSIESNNSDSNKPTLSVFSFKSNKSKTTNFESNFINYSDKKEGANILGKITKNLSNISASNKEVPLDKISFIPRDYIDMPEENKISSGLNLKNIELAENEKPKPYLVKKDYNVSKITILKKQSIPDVNTTDNSYKEKISYSLRRIIFPKSSEGSTSELHVLKNNQGRNNHEVTSKNQNIRFNRLNNSNLGNHSPKLTRVENLTENKISNKSEVIKNSIEAKSSPKINSTTHKDELNKNVDSPKSDKSTKISNGETQKHASEKSNSDNGIKVRNNKTNVEVKSGVNNLSQEEKNKTGEIAKTDKASVKTIKKETIKKSTPKIKSKEVKNSLNTLKEENTTENKTADISKTSDGSIKKIIDEKNDGNNIKAENKGAKTNENKTDNASVKHTTANKTVDLENKVETEKVSSKTDNSSKEPGNANLKSEDKSNAKIAKSFERKNISADGEKSSDGKIHKEIFENKEHGKSVEKNATENIKIVNSSKTQTDNSVKRDEPTLKNDHTKLHNTSEVKSEVHKSNEKSQANIAGVNLPEEKSIKNDNKKLSLKVKGGVKKVSSNNSSESEPANVNKFSEGSQNQNNTESGTNLGGNSQNSPHAKDFANAKHSIDHNFTHVLHKEGIKSVEAQVAAMPKHDTDSNSRVIKSIEVVKEISKFIAQKEKGTFSFNIEPEHLGKMKITLDTIDNLLKATIEVDNTQAKQMVERNINKLYNQLSENGVQLNSLNISLGYSKNNKAEGKTKNNKSNKSEENSQVGETEGTNKQKKSLGYNTYEYIA